MRFEHYLGWTFKRLIPKFKNAPNQVIHLMNIWVKGNTLCLRYIVHQRQVYNQQKDRTERTCIHNKEKCFIQKNICTLYMKISTNI